jgi:arylsulfatase A-like enzyme
MTSRTDVVSKAETTGSVTPGVAVSRLGFTSLLVLSAWCGLVAGSLEVSTIVFRKQVFDPNHLYKMSRHFVWLIPLSNVFVFVALALLGGSIILIWPRHGRWMFMRILCAITLLPCVLVAFPRIYGLAWFIVTLGMAARLVPLVERRGPGFRRFVLVNFPAAIVVVASLAASLWASDRAKQARENARAMPPPESPNVLLVVMDTVAAGHLSLHGYGRATSTTLVELAEHGIQFDAARATSSWTLPSHASMFTERWMHELSVGWFAPLDRTYPTLTEYLGERGYATAGFVANTFYCATDSGLARGFAYYQDFIFPELTAFKMSVLVSRAQEGFQVIVYFTEDWLEWSGLLPYALRVWRALDTDRKGATVINRELLDWLSTRGQSERPFFAFLNYYDAHSPYQLPPGRLHRFGVEPTDNYQRVLIEHWWDIDKTTVSPEGLAFAADAYDDCIADLDEQIGKLVDELERRGDLERTWLIITSDHGESFGEHAGVFCHGTSLYETELHVPLIIIPPGGRQAKLAVKETVSLRDVAATVVELAGVGSGSPFPGDSLARFWKEAQQQSARRSSEPALSEVIPSDPRKRDYWGVPEQLSPLRAVKEGEWSYIRREADVREELFHLHNDPKEQRNLAGDSNARAVLEQMRIVLDRVAGGPLRPQRFNH